MKSMLKKLTPRFLQDCYYWAVALAGAVYYGFPARKLVVIGVTGTNGKSTTVDLIARILEKAGYLVASASSVRFRVAGKESLNTLKMTMPGRMALQRFLREAVDAGCKYAVIEVTSEGIAQRRHKFINFDTAVLTNVTPEHIESHGGFEKYKQAKGELFKRVKTIVVNGDDPSAEYFLQFPANKRIIYRTKYQILDTKYKNCDTAQATNITQSRDGVSFELRGETFHLNLLGEFNAQNALAAICATQAQGVELETIKDALAEVKGEPGRMEAVIAEPFTVFVDYAHTPDALENVYKTVEDSGYKNENSHMICVLGSAGGGRDKWKRPEMGKIAARHCDEIILTNEDPYEENPSVILEQIAEGFSQTTNHKPQTTTSYHSILNRREAIRKALELAKPGDTVIITGKGCEPWMMTKNGRIPWDDRAVVREEYKKLKGI